MTWQIGSGVAVAAIVLGYLLGSIPFGLLLTRMAGLGDIRAIGSGNIGATNVLRTGNKKLAAATLLLDALKATAAALAGFYIAGPEAGLLAGFGAFIGHLFPVWIGFKGGKGVATYIGTLLGVAPLWVLAFAAVWLTVAFVSRYSSLSALVATLVIPVALWIVGEEKIALVMAIMTAVSWWRHEANIKRLLAGTEGKIGQKG
ncbi:MAG: glycerol-3-phosphate 1-O-acyltransferase PlsY [Alphaproteobacteria bacterium]|uniref:glycerol-3-phosphate 1-O-acyltransferase PlsY n=1 Tax=Pseudorhizobium pelagicum TaxID=1509405 RepID=UPI001D25D8FA|nr:glycerol-3-phosphate 1-O-acyltransferase PlsY [Alphaproteobacteria bacterium]MBU1551927.1 glycerol-3-phosphate 1-O-acyltransferase PlsY [Alphaproteobacteria bacterium]MBU2335355.1 glycerol-3-phosphate 1-O-acyltransferase PlsY [Alphaproteobacteria bacterium]MBU2391385.1 glycerol-3-phosphate 1-O-acyltransferase PlsY [Alphaproteobacteria bacterium]